MTIKQAAVMNMAWQIHREVGHQPEYDGPCWGPTPDDVAEAKRRLAQPETPE